MKLRPKLNLLAVTVLLALTASIVVVGMLAIDEIIVEMNGRLLRRDLSNVLRRLPPETRYPAEANRSPGNTEPSRSFGSLRDYLDARGTNGTERLFILERPNDLLFTAGSPPGLSPGVADVAEMFRRKQGFMKLSLAGTTHLAAFEVVSGGNRLVIQSVSLAEMLGAKTRYLERVGLGALGIMGILVVVSTLFVGRLAARIEKTLDCIHAVEQGDLARRIAPNVSEDEIGNLQRSLNSMIGTIEKRTIEQQKDREALLASEEKYRSIFENAIEGIYQSSPEGRFLSVNPAMARILGFDGPQDVLEAYTDIRTQLYVEPEDRDKLQDLFHKEGRAERFETRMHRRDGAVIWVSITASTVWNGDRRPLYYEGILEDITDRKQVHDALESEKRFIEGAMDTLTDAFLVFDLKGKLLRWNKTIAAASGYGDKEIAAMFAVQFFPADEHPKLFDALNRIIAHGHATLEASLLTRYGGRIAYEFTGDLLKDLEGRPSHICVVGRDITERKRAELEIRRLNERLEQRVAERTAELESANQELKDFAYAVSHDLKAPLRAINQLAGWISMDYGEALGQEGKEQIDLLMGRVRRMHGLIEGILQYSRIGRVREREREVDLDSLARDVIDLVSPPQHITINIETQLPVVVGEPTRLAQLFQNLLDNAIKYMDKTNGKVIISCLNQDDQWTFRISDNGSGIEEKYFDKIFQIFQTLAPRDESESTGIGLALVKRIVELGGGKIWLESELGKGTTFCFTIPDRRERK
ncbi:MAG: PAS domain S-box protein [Pseudomonadota bacterium]